MASKPLFATGQFQQTSLPVNRICAILLFKPDENHVKLSDGIPSASVPTSTGWPLPRPDLR
jgi:hypothetical protein